MNKKTKIAVIGAGQFGFYICKYLGENEFENVFVYDLEKEIIEYLKNERKHPKHFAGIQLPDSVNPTTSLEKCISKAEIIFTAVPAQKMRKATIQFREYINRDIMIINVAKALELDTNKRMDEIFDDELKDYLKDRHNYEIAAIAGGMLAREGVLDHPLSADIACKKITIARRLARLLKSDKLRLKPTDDLTGVELAGALKNVYAIAGGTCKGLNYGISSLSALISECSEEGRRFAIEYGANGETFNTGSQAWLADLITTVMGGRNSMFGQEIGEGLSPEAALEKMKKQDKGTIEGHATAKVVYELSRNYKGKYPLIRQIYEVLYNRKSPKEAMQYLMRIPHLLNKKKK